MKYFIGFLPFKEAKFHLFNDEKGIVSLCGQKRAVSSGHSTLEFKNGKTELRTPLHEYPLEFNNLEFCKKCLNRKNEIEKR